MSIFKYYWRLLFPAIVPSLAVFEQGNKKNIRKKVASLSTGNVSLQFGRYVTEQDIAALRKKVLNHKFSQ